MSKILNVFQKLHLHALIEVLQLTVPSSNAASQCLPNSLQAQESYPHPQRYFIRDSYFRVRLPKIIHWLYLLLDKVDIHLILSKLCVDHFENQWTTLHASALCWVVKRGPLSWKENDPAWLQVKLFLCLCPVANRLQLTLGERNRDNPMHFNRKGFYF